MRISPVSSMPTIAVVRKTTPVMRSSAPAEDETPLDEDAQADPDAAPRRRRPQLSAPTGAGAHSSNAVLSALIDLQTGPRS